MLLALLIGAIVAGYFITIGLVAPSVIREAQMDPWAPTIRKRVREGDYSGALSHALLEPLGVVLMIAMSGVWMFLFPVAVVGGVVLGIVSLV